MSDPTPPVGPEALQFDRVIAADDSLGSVLRDRGAATCEICRQAIDTEYHQVNGKVVCGSCRARIESALETPRGVATLLRAAAFGLGAGIFGAIIYYGVIALLNLEIGIVAILIGYMVGYATRTGARGRGGRRFQVLAVALTYASISLAYTPLVFKGLADNETQATQTVHLSPAAQAGDRQAAPETRTAATEDRSTSPGASSNPIVALALLLLFVAALPVIIVFGSLPSGLISAAIIFFGMAQAWRMTGAPKVEILGPYRVGAASATTSV